MSAVYDFATQLEKGQKQCTKCGEWKSYDQFHREPRHTDGLRSDCKSCRKVRDHAYRAANAESQAERSRAYYEANKERVNARNRAYYAAHAEQLREYRRDYVQTNSDQVKQSDRNYRNANQGRMKDYERAYRKTPRGKSVRRAAAARWRARERGQGVTVTSEDLAAIRLAQTDKKGRLICWKCGRPIIGNEPPPHRKAAALMPPHLDHWNPLSKDGSSSAGNLHYMHGICNLEKGAKHPTELGRLL